MSMLQDIIDMIRVKPGKKFRLKDHDPAWAGDKERAQEGAQGIRRENALRGLTALAEAQDLLYASDTYSILLIFQAMDAAGKDSTIKHVMSGVNPQGCQVFSLQASVRRGARPQLPVALRESACPSAAASASSTARITRRSWS